MIIYLAGEISGNIAPAWKTMARRGGQTQDDFVKALKDENFWRGGESRHWIQDATSPIKENEAIFG